MDWTMRAMLWRSRAGSIGLRVMTGVLGVDDGVRVRDGQPVREVGPGGAVDVRIEHFVHLPEGLPVDAHSHHGTVGTGLVDQGSESFAEPDALALEAAMRGMPISCFSETVRIKSMTGSLSTKL